LLLASSQVGLRPELTHITVRMNLWGGTYTAKLGKRKKSNKKKKKATKVSGAATSWLFVAS